MTAIIKIQIDGVEQTSNSFEIGAFNGNSITGAERIGCYGSLGYNRAYLSVFGTNGSPYDVTFKLYNHETYEVLENYSISYEGEPYTFTWTGDTHIGDNTKPLVINFLTSPITTYTRELSEGWNWVSIYLDLSDGNGIAMLEAALGDYANSIVTEFESADYFGDGEWVGLEDYVLTNGEMILIEAAEDCTVTLEGMPVDPATVEITLNPGWNWIGFPFDTEVEIEAAFANFEPEDEDIISDTYGSSDYLGEWVGDIVTLVPGQGYLYYNASGETKTLVFSTGAKGKMR